MLLLRQVQRNAWSKIDPERCRPRVHPLIIHTPSIRSVVQPAFTRTLTTLPTCPSPTCSCQEMPGDLDIDRKLPLSNTMPAYHQHLLIPTGRTDWTSRIEDDKGLGVVKEIKEMLGPKGEFANPFYNVMLTASSHAPPPGTNDFSAILLPRFQYITSTESTSATLKSFVQAFVLPSQLDNRMPDTNSDHASNLTQKSEMQKEFSASKINDVVVLICGHNARDSRCGILGPILQTEFEEKLGQTPYTLKKSWTTKVAEQNTEKAQTGSIVAQISHIGGHKFAGNIIIYIPPILESHPLAGKGIWYGRVAPKHVEGIVKKTIEEGVIIEELFRGGVGMDGEVMRL